MADTIVNTPPQTNASGNNGMGFLVGVVILVVFLLLFIFYGLPYLRSSFLGSTPQVNIPSHYDVNVKQSK